MSRRKRSILSTRNWACGVLLFVLQAGAASISVPWSELSSVSLPPPCFADLEATTNMPMPNLARQTGRFAFSLGCLVTPTNNVEVAFGTDENANGALEPEESDVVVGWDAGRWCVERDFVMVASSTGVSAVGSVQTLTWVLDVYSNGAPVGLDARVDGTPYWLYLERYGNEERRLSRLCPRYDNREYLAWVRTYERKLLTYREGNRLTQEEYQGICADFEKSMGRRPRTKEELQQ